MSINSIFSKTGNKYKCRLKGRVSTLGTIIKGFIRTELPRMTLKSLIPLKTHLYGQVLQAESTEQKDESAKIIKNLERL